MFPLTFVHISLCTKTPNAWLFLVPTLKSPYDSTGDDNEEECTIERVRYLRSLIDIPGIIISYGERYRESSLCKSLLKGLFAGAKPKIKGLGG